MKREEILKILSENKSLFQEKYKVNRIGSLAPMQKVRKQKIVILI